MDRYEVARLGAAFQEQLLNGNVRELVGKTLVVKLVAKNTVEVQILDEKDRCLVYVQKTLLVVGASLTVTHLEMLFDVKLEF